MVHTRRAAFFVCCLLGLADPAFGSPKDDLVGLWKFKRGVRGPCASQILGLTYTFRKDGSYRSKAKMSTGAELEYSGTYTATDTVCTAHVEGATVGPYPYKIVGDVLSITQPEFGCEVELEREDY